MLENWSQTDSQASTLTLTLSVNNDCAVFGVNEPSLLTLFLHVPGTHKHRDNNIMLISNTNAAHQLSAVCAIGINKIIITVILCV